MPGFVAAENLARDARVREQAKALLDLTWQVRTDRAVVEQRWQRYFKIWACDRDQKAYHGRYEGYLPVGRTAMEKWVKRLRQLLFPETDWFAVAARRHAAEERVPALRGLQEYFFTKQMGVEQQASPYCRALATYGTAPVRHVWRVEERRQQMLREELDAEGRPLPGRYQRVLELVRDLDGPTFTPVDLFRFYVWPETCASVDDADLAFEDMLLPLSMIQAKFKTPLVPGREKEFGHVYENAREFRDYLALLARDDVSKPTTVGQDQQKFEAERARLMKLGFQHLVDQKLPAPNRLLDVTEHLWHADLGEGMRRYLVTTVGPVIVRIQENPFWHGRSLWLAGRFVKVQGEFYGRSLLETIDRLQYFINDMADQAADALVWATTPIALIDLAGVQDPDSLRLAPGAKWFAAKGSVELAEPPQGAANAGFQGVSAMMGIANEVGNPSPLGALGTAQRGRSRSQQTASGMAILSNEATVDIAEVVAQSEADVFTPLLWRNHLLAQQFLSRDVILRVAGQDGVSFVERTITVADLVGDFDFRWLASTAQKNAEIRGQQIINFMMMASKIPPEALAQENRRIDWAFLLEQAWTVGFGLRNGERVVVPIEKDDVTDWRLENDLFRANRGREVKLSPQEPHLEHAQGHDLLLRDPRVAAVVKREVTAHIAEHIQALVAQQMAQAMQAMQAMPGPGDPGPGMGAGPGHGNGGRLPAPLGPGRMAQTGGMDDLFRQMPRGTGPVGSLG